MFTYKLKAPDGTIVEYTTIEKTATDLKNKHDIEVDFWSKDGWSVIKGGETAPATQANVDPSFCTIHNCKMVQRQGKYGPFYSHAQKLGNETIYCNGKGFGKK